MLRRAVIRHLAATVPGLGGRVYQAMLGPRHGDRPYATVKVVEGPRSHSIGFAGTTRIEVRLYDDPGSYVSLDALDAAVVAALHGVLVTDLEDGLAYRLEHEPGGGDFGEDDMIGRILFFETPAVKEPTGGA